MEFFEHLKLGCWWDIPTLILLIAATACFFVRRHQLNKKKRELENQLLEK